MISTPRTTTRSALTLASLLLFAVVDGCEAPQRETGGQPVTPAEEPESTMEPIPYPRGGWRLMEEAALDGFVVWPAHILIRYAGADDDVPFTLFDWHTSEPAPPRSRAQALALAERVAARVAENPAAFAAFAAEHSEDAPTRAIGGELGGLRAADLSDEPEVLDALSALRVGEVSRPVETSHGLHIVVRRAPPPPQVVTGRRIVISHDDADWEGPAASRPRRTLEEARELARQLHERLAVGAVDFDAAARQSSDWHDAGGGSALGSWSVRQSSPLGRELAALRTLDVGQVSAPLAGPLGLELLMRTASSSPEPSGPEARLDLPAAERPELESVLARVPARVVMSELDALVENLSVQSPMAPDQWRLLAEARVSCAPVRASTADGPQTTSFADSVRAFLAADVSARYRPLLAERLGARVLNARVIRVRQKLADSPSPRSTR